MSFLGRDVDGYIDEVFDRNHDGILDVDEQEMQAWFLSGEEDMDMAYTEEAEDEFGYDFTDDYTNYARTAPVSRPTRRTDSLKQPTQVVKETAKEKEKFNFRKWANYWFDTPLKKVAAWSLVGWAGFIFLVFILNLDLQEYDVEYVYKIHGLYKCLDEFLEVGAYAIFWGVIALWLLCWYHYIASFLVGVVCFFFIFGSLYTLDFYMDRAKRECPVEGCPLFLCSSIFDEYCEFHQWVLDKYGVIDEDAKEKYWEEYYEDSSGN